MGDRLTAKAAQDIGKLYLNGIRQFGPHHALLENSFRFLARNPMQPVSGPSSRHQSASIPCDLTS